MSDCNRIVFVESAILEVTTSIENETTESTDELFSQGEVIDCEIIEEPDEESTTIQFGDGSVILSIPNELFERVTDRRGQLFLDQIKDCIEMKGALNLYDVKIDFTGTEIYKHILSCITVSSVQYLNHWKDDDPDNIVIVMKIVDSSERGTLVATQEITQDNLCTALLCKDGKLQINLNKKINGFDYYLFLEKLQPIPFI